MIINETAYERVSKLVKFVCLHLSSSVSSYRGWSMNRDRRSRGATPRFARNYVIITRESRKKVQGEQTERRKGAGIRALMNFARVITSCVSRNYTAIKLWPLLLINNAAIVLIITPRNALRGRLYVTRTRRYRRSNTNHGVFTVCSS